MSSSMQFVLTPLPATDEQVIDKLKETSDKLNGKGGSTIQTHSVFNSIRSVPVTQAVVGPNHVAILLEDGRICRAAYSIFPERLDMSTGNDGTGPGSKGTSNLGGSGSGGGGGPGSKSSGPTSGSAAAAALRARMSATSSARRGRILRTSGRGRNASSVIMGSGRPVVPAQFVPEDLISQAQVVLQGKSRSVLIRELQRTNLDVNLAVNNLLSRDDEESEDMDDSQDSYLPSDELISLLDAGIHTDHPAVIIDTDAVFPEDVFSYSSAVRVRPTSRMSSRSGLTAEEVRLRDPSAPDRESGHGSSIRFGERFVGSSGSSSSRRWLEYALRDSGAASDGSKSPGLLDQNSGIARKRLGDGVSPLNPLFVSEQLEFWTNPTPHKKFTQIACLFSELIAVNSVGQLFQWKWSDSEPFRTTTSDGQYIYHPKTVSLALAKEQITFLAASTIRASVTTDSQKIATWVDDSVYPSAAKLEHPAHHVVQDVIGLEHILSLHVSSLFTVVRLDSGSMFWWGVPPYNHRKKVWEKVKSKAKKAMSTSKSGQSSSSTDQSSEMVTGVQVCLRNSPLYHAGAVAFTTAGGIPRVGILQTSAWSITDSCTFKLVYPTVTSDKSRSPATTSSIPSIIFPGASASTSSAPSQVSAPKSASPSPSTPMFMSSLMDIGPQPASPARERLEMPPPPSPASSTCSEPGASPLPKRSKTGRLSTPLLKEAEERKEEEVWSLKDVVFLEDVKNVPVGRVIKIDGQYAAVRFQSTGQPSLSKPFPEPSVTSSGSDDLTNILQECRLLRKDELQLVKGSASTRTPECFQRYPRRIRIPESTQIVTMTVSTLGIHAIVKSRNRLAYITYSVTSGKVEQEWVFATDPNAFMGQDRSLISLQSVGENEVVTILKDGNGVIYPISKDYTDSIKDPITLDMAPVQAIGMGIYSVKDALDNQKNQVSVMFLALETQLLTPAIIRSDPDLVRLTLASLERDSITQQVIVSERVDRNRNILHSAVSACFPTSNKPTYSTSSSQASSSNIDAMLLDEGPSYHHLDHHDRLMNDLLGSSSSRGLTLQEMMVLRRSSSRRQPDSNSNSQQEMDLSAAASASHLDLDAHNSSLSPPVVGAVGGNSTWTSAAATSTMDQSPFLDPSEQKSQALSVLWILTESNVLKPYLKELMSAKDASGCTPFMLAVKGRAYSAALHLFNVAQRIAKFEVMSEAAAADAPTTSTTIHRRILLSMIFPRGSNPDDSPLNVLCLNDTCSFTWTGAEHINQDIFECKTCGLTGSLCCCTECARVCHKGHDCKLKRTSPTAYCDCWEKCKCQALIQGSQTSRYQLLKKLLSETDLVTCPNSKGESILLFLVSTVGRQIQEQRQYRPTRSSRSLARKNPAMVGDNQGELEMPDHDLEPPRFARKALDKILSDWTALKSMLLAGMSRQQLKKMADVSVDPTDLSGDFISNQSGTALLDKFVHSLLVKVGPEMLDTLLNTIIRESSSPNPSVTREAKVVARRFVRSVARFMVSLCIGLNPTTYQNVFSQSLASLNMASGFASGSALSGYQGLYCGPGSLASWRSKSGSSSSTSTSSTTHQLVKCRRVFQALLPVAIEELSELAEAIIAPVRLGVCRPTLPFGLVSSSSAANDSSSSWTEELFSAEPIRPASYRGVLHFSPPPIQRPSQSSRQGVLLVPRQRAARSIEADLEPDLNLPPDDPEVVSVTHRSHHQQQHLRHPSSGQDNSNGSSNQSALLGNVDLISGGNAVDADISELVGNVGEEEAMDDGHSQIVDALVRHAVLDPSDDLLGDSSLLDPHHLHRHPAQDILSDNSGSSSDSDDEANLMDDNASDFLSNVDRMSTAQRSATTRATAGSDAGISDSGNPTGLSAYFSDEDSGSSGDDPVGGESVGLGPSDNNLMMDDVDDRLGPIPPIRRQSGAAGVGSVSGTNSAGDGASNAVSTMTGSVRRRQAEPGQLEEDEVDDDEEDDVNDPEEDDGEENRNDNQLIEEGERPEEEPRSGTLRNPSRRLGRVRLVNVPSRHDQEEEEEADEDEEEEDVDEDEDEEDDEVDDDEDGSEEDEEDESDENHQRRRRRRAKRNFFGQIPDRRRRRQRLISSEREREETSRRRDEEPENDSEQNTDTEGETEGGGSTSAHRFFERSTFSSTTPATSSSQTVALRRNPDTATTTGTSGIARQIMSGVASAATTPAGLAAASSTASSSTPRNNLAQFLQLQAARHSTSSAAVGSSTVGASGSSSGGHRGHLIHIDPTTGSTTRRATSAATSDGHLMGRSVIGSSTSALAAAAAHGHHHPSAVIAHELASSSGASMTTTSVGLSRSFSILIRQLASLIPLLQNDGSTVDLSGSGSNNRIMPFTHAESVTLIQQVEGRLFPTWEWLVSVLDSTEGQLRFGCSLTNSSTHPATLSTIATNSASTLSSSQHQTNSRQVATMLDRLLTINQRLSSSLASGARNSPSSRLGGSSSGRGHHHPSSYGSPYHLQHHLHQDHHNFAEVVASGGSPSTQGGTSSGDPSIVSRMDFLSYVMSLMRGHNNEHLDSLPVLDVSNLRHIAYVFDSFICYLRSGFVLGSTATNHSVRRSRHPQELSSVDKRPNKEAAQVPSGSGKTSQHPQHWRQRFLMRQEEGSTQSSSRQQVNTPSGDDASTNDVKLMTIDWSGVPVPPTTPTTSCLHGMDLTTTQVKTEEDKKLKTKRETERRPNRPSSPSGSRTMSGENRRFFRRSDSTLYLGCLIRPDPFKESLSVSLPLAEHPQLLEGTSRREDLFGMGGGSDNNILLAIQNPLLCPLPSSEQEHEDECDRDDDEKRGEREPRSPWMESSTASFPLPHVNHARISLSQRNRHLSSVQMEEEEEKYEQHLNSQHPSLLGSRERHDLLLGRWRLSLQIFGRVFVEDVGSEPGSVMVELAGFPVKEAKFRKDMERLKSAASSSTSSSHGGSSSSGGAPIRDLVFKVDREPGLLIHETFRTLNTFYEQRLIQQHQQHHHQGSSRRSAASSASGYCGGSYLGGSGGHPSSGTNSLPLLAVPRVKVTFKDEPGEGSGVARSFYTCFAEAVLARDVRLPDLVTCQVPSGVSSGASGQSHPSSSSSHYSSNFHNQYNLIQRLKGQRTTTTTTATSTSTTGKAGSSSPFYPSSSSRANPTTTNNQGTSTSLSSTTTSGRSGAQPPVDVFDSLHLFNLSEGGSSVSGQQHHHQLRSSSLSNRRSTSTNISNSNRAVVNELDLLRQQILGRTSSSSSSTFHHHQRMAAASNQSSVINLRGRLTTSQHRWLQQQQQPGSSGSRRILSRGEGGQDDDEDEDVGVNDEGLLQEEEQESDPIERELNEFIRSNDPQSSRGGIDEPPLTTTRSSTVIRNSRPSPSQSQPPPPPIPSTATFFDSLLAACLSASVDRLPLFYQPSGRIRGFYSPCLSSPSPSSARLNAYRNVGRMLGLSLLQNELSAITLNRHVLKYLLGRPISWHDLAFFDGDLYESLRLLVVQAMNQDGDDFDEDFFATLDLRFTIDVSIEESGGVTRDNLVLEDDYDHHHQHDPSSALTINDLFPLTIELVPGGKNMVVTKDNVLDYVRYYSEYRMVKAQGPALDALRDGLYDVIPRESLVPSIASQASTSTTANYHHQAMTAEDLRLLLNGTNDVNVVQLMSFTTWNDESGLAATMAAAAPSSSSGGGKNSNSGRTGAADAATQTISTFKKWFWSIVSRMSRQEKADLVYFWTGSPSLPASEDGFQPMPTVTIRPPDDQHFPTANTCISRLYIPLYSSRSILRAKLLTAVKVKNFGFV